MPAGSSVLRVSPCSERLPTGNDDAPLRAAAGPTVSRFQVKPIGVPNLPNVVTVIPFSNDTSGTNVEQTKILISAGVNAWSGLFVVDLGVPHCTLNGRRFKVSPTGGIDDTIHTDYVRIQVKPDTAKGPRALHDAHRQHGAGLRQRRGGSRVGS